MFSDQDSLVLQLNVIDMFERGPGLWKLTLDLPEELEMVDRVKLLGVTISSSLSWNRHIHEVIKKASKRLYFLVQLKRDRVQPNDLVLFYTASIR